MIKTRECIAAALLIWFVVWLWGCGPRESPAVFSHEFPEYAQLLVRHVDTDGRVDYRGLAADSARLRQAVAALAGLSPDSLTRFTREQRLCLWLNAYNLLTLQAVAEAFPVASIKDIDGIWDERRFHVGGLAVTLNDIANKFLRQEFEEPRIHFAIVRASTSCPVLRREPYRADSVKEQLHQATQRFLTDTVRNHFAADFQQADLSRLFEWYGRDFVNRYGSMIPADQPETVRAVLNFIAEALPDAVGRFLREEDVTVTYLEFDWDLNSQRRD